MQTRESSTSNHLLADISQFFGFLPPIFTPTRETPEVMRNLLTQTLSAYINNPLPLRFKEKLLAYLSRYCSVPYCIVCHSCALRSLGMTAGEVLALLYTPAPTDQEAAEHIRTLAAIDAPLQTWPEPGSPLEKSLLLLTFFLFSQPKSAEECRHELRRLLGAGCFNHLIDLLFFVKTYHFWAETHPRLDYRSDRRTQENLGLLYAEKPELVNFFSTYAQRVRSELDLTTHKQLEAKLHRSEREAASRGIQLEAVFEAMTDGVVVYDGDGSMLRMNSTYRNMIALDKYPEHALLTPDQRGDMLDLRDEHGQPLHSSQRPVTRMLNGDVMIGNNVMDIMVHALDGHEIQLNISGTPMRDSEGHIVGGVMVFRDVTERRKFERRTHEALQGLLAMAEALVQVPEYSNTAGNSHEHISVVSSFAQRLAELMRQVLGCRRIGITLIEQTTGEFYPLAIAGVTPEQMKQWQASFNDAPAPEPFASSLNTDDTHAAGAQPPGETYISPFNLQHVLNVPLQIGSHVVGMMSVDYSDSEHEYTQDELALAGAVAKLAALIIERERLLQERTAAQANELALLEANRRMDEFMGIASHELKTPLTTIKGYIQLAARRLKNHSGNQTAYTDDQTKSRESARELLERTDSQIERLSRLVNELLDVSRVQANKLELHLEDCDLAAIVHEAVEDQQQELPERTIVTDLPPGVVPVTIDAHRTSQVMSNYLSNALKYSASDLPIEVRLELSNEAACVLVRDEGPGLSEEAQERIWERFYRTPGTEVLSGSGVGLGLGLYICKTIIERHRGQVGVVTAPGAGSTFWFSLPLTKRAMNEAFH
jgi:signal transduction histidine kinase/PAS domain-containing protein